MPVLMYRKQVGVHRNGPFSFRVRYVSALTNKEVCTQYHLGYVDWAPSFQHLWQERNYYEHLASKAGRSRLQMASLREYRIGKGLVPGDIPSLHANFYYGALDRCDKDGIGHGNALGYPPRSVGPEVHLGRDWRTTRPQASI